MSKYLLKARGRQALVLGNLLYVRVCVFVYWGVRREGRGREANKEWGLTPLCLQDGLVKEAKDRLVKSSPLQGKGEMNQEASGNNMNDQNSRLPLSLSHLPFSCLLIPFTNSTLVLDSDPVPDPVFLLCPSAAGLKTFPPLHPTAALAILLIFHGLFN